MPEERPILYGRRRGRVLRPGQRVLKETLLPQVSFTLPDSGPDSGQGSGGLDPSGLFAGTPAALWLEIGFGGGEHLAVQAERHPAIGLIGAEVFENGIVKLLAAIEARGLANVRIFAGDARALLAALPPASLARIFILFPDPWPKLRHHKRRLVSPATLDRLALVMADGAELRLATDDRAYLCRMLEVASDHPEFTWLARRPADWRERPADWPPTRYEEKARAAGRAPAFLRLQRRARRG